MSLGLELQHERAFLRRLDSVAIRELPGFVRGRHRMPTEHGRAGDLFVQTLVEPALADEVRVVYDAAKRVLGLRRRQLQRAIAVDGGNVEAPQFHYVIEICLDPADISRALWRRRVIPLLAPRALPIEFDEVFPIACDELVVPLVKPRTIGVAERFDLIVERLEDFTAVHGGGVEEDEDQARASLTTHDGSRIALDLGTHELSLRMLGVSGCRALLLEAERRFAELTGPIVSGLGADARA
ncbi:hypothetical protein [Enhygromyxa salina]|uniref:Uncharacterized protein n=1 Tax=Enhygromyxa salina TaxID=215803 RepID=A0A2S9YUX2_9BACT|nr:hypothetical protein [Enhygromyxa salina]PRQ08886.1 hypothetical protein ENSA7_13760 [Enhygromyxa salina]